MMIYAIIQFFICLISTSGDSQCDVMEHLWLLVDPVELGLLPALDLAILEPQSNLLLGVVDAVAAVADVAADVL